MKKSNRILIFLLSALFLLFIGLHFAATYIPDAQITIENRQESLYDTARIPPVGEGGGININTADASLLSTLPGIGETLSFRIVAHREEWGKFLHPASITEVEGIGEKTYAKIKDKIGVK
ncbi:MAG: helix-hairpin-helix domain-containing protein [Clostridia bacterium]|nr:helix-hairpin-helix domain-containing protein [Clostridia bacterium]